MNLKTRREFTKTIGLGSGAFLVAPSLFATTGQRPPKKLNIALCGLGRYANIVAKSFKDSQFCHLSGIVTGTPSKIESWRNTYQIPEQNVFNYENFDSLVDNKEIDLIYITLPNSMHKEYTIRAARAGKHVIVEKPMALNQKDCLEMIEVCKNQNVQLAVGYRLHYEPHHLELMRLGQKKVFGQVKLIESSLGYSLKGIDTNDWHLIKNLSGGGPLMNLGVYSVQIARYVLGEEPVSVTAQFGPVTHPDLFREVEESITWQLNFKSGCVSTSSSTYSSRLDRFYAAAESGFFELNPAMGYGPFKGRSSAGPFDFPIINQQAAQIDGIAENILSNQPLPDHIAGIEGYKDMKVLDAIYLAADTGKRINI